MTEKTRSGEITRLFGTEDRTFRLTPVRWEKVQEKCHAGPPEVARRLAIAALPKVPGAMALEIAAMGRLGQWNIQDVRTPILQGLIGGGLREEDAEKLCRELVDERPLMECVPLALEVVMASLFGPDEEPIPGGAPRATGRNRTASRTSRSGSRKSTASPRS